MLEIFDTLVISNIYNIIIQSNNKHNYLSIGFIDTTLSSDKVP